MSDIFGRELTYGGGFLPEDTTVSMSGISGGAIVRNLQIGYEQQISRIWDLGTGSCFFIAGHTNGTWQIGKIAGPGASITALGGYTVCAPGTIKFTGGNGLCFPGGASAGKAANYELKSVITAKVNVSVSSEDMIINEGIGGTFLILDVT